MAGKSANEIWGLGDYRNEMASRAQHDAEDAAHQMERLASDLTEMAHLLRQYGPNMAYSRSMGKQQIGRQGAEIEALLTKLAYLGEAQHDLMFLEQRNAELAAKAAELAAKGAAE